MSLNQRKAEEAQEQDRARASRMKAMYDHIQKNDLTDRLSNCTKDEAEALEGLTYLRMPDLLPQKVPEALFERDPSSEAMSTVPISADVLEAAFILWQMKNSKPLSTETTITATSKNVNKKKNTGSRSRNASRKGSSAKQDLGKRRRIAEPKEENAMDGMENFPTDIEKSTFEVKTANKRPADALNKENAFSTKRPAYTVVRVKEGDEEWKKATSARAQDEGNATAVGRKGSVDEKEYGKGAGKTNRPVIKREASETSQAWEDWIAEVE